MLIAKENMAVIFWFFISTSKSNPQDKVQVF